MSKVVVRVPNWLGDAIMALPSVAAVRDSGQLIVAGPAGFAPIFEEFEFLPLSSSWDWRPLSRVEAQRIVLLTNSFSTAFAAWRSGIRERIGYAMHGRSMFLTDALPYSNEPHQIERYSIIARAAGFTVADGEPSLSRAPDPEFDPGYVLLAPGARYGSAKRWGGFSRLAELLLDSGRRVVVAGREDECRDMSFPRKNGLVNLTGKTDLARLLSVVAGSSAVVSNDSGVSHCARALGRPALVIFGPTDPVRTLAPGAVPIAARSIPCAPCHLRVCPINHRCMESISPEYVHARVEGTLGS